MPAPTPTPLAIPKTLYAEVAPMNIPMANHLLLRLWRRTHAPVPELLTLLLTEIQEKRQNAFYHMDSYVRNRDKPVAPELRFSTAWMRQVLAVYTPGRTVPASTFTEWSTKRAIRFERKGRPFPDSAAALYIARMIDTGERNFLPEAIAEDEPLWWCYAQLRPQEPIFCHPVTRLDELPPATLLWTGWHGAAWEARWHFVGDEAHGLGLGAVAFAGIQQVRGHRTWHITLDDLARWDDQVTSLYVNYENNTSQIQALATVALERLARTRLGNRVILADADLKHIEQAIPPNE